MAQDPPGHEYWLPESYHDDFSEEEILITSLEVIPETTGELAGSPNDKGTDPHSTTEEGSTYAEIISNARVRAALKRPIRLCKYHSVPVCVLVLEINLFETVQTRQLPRLLRFKAVDVTVEFKNPPNDTGSKTSSKFGPEVVMFCPESYTGEPTVVTHFQSNTIGASVNSSNALPAGLGLGVQHKSESQYSKTSACTITGRTLLLGSSARVIKWEISEDAALKSGVPKSLRLVMAVTSPEEKAFNMKLNFSANLGFGDVQFKVKKSQRVMTTRVDPRALREQAANHSLGEAAGRAWQCAVDEEEVKVTDLETLTNLKGSTVGKTHGTS